MTGSAHYFIAVPVVSELKEEFASWQSQLKDTFPYKLWPHKEDLHITLKFLGAVDDEMLPKLRETLRSIQGEKFSLSVGNIGTFGKQDSPRVLWAGVEKVNLLEELFQKVEGHVTSLGLAKENRPYRPHITLAKKWNGLPISSDKLMEIKSAYQTKMFPMQVESFVLYQIHPSRTPKYEAVELYHL